MEKRNPFSNQEEIHVSQDGMNLDMLERCLDRIARSNKVNEEDIGFVLRRAFTQDRHSFKGCRC